jgi:transposase
MKNLKYGIGLDIAAKKFDACISVINEVQKTTILSTGSFENTSKGFMLMLKWVDKHCKEILPVIFLMEATGIYYEQLAWFLYQKDKSVVVILANKARKYKEVLGLKSKTDSIDSRGLAQMVCEQHLKHWTPISKGIYQLRLNTRQIERISSHITQFTGQLHAIMLCMYRDPVIEKMISSNLALLEKQKLKLEKKIQSIIDADPILKERFRKICKIKGLGTLTLAVIIAETDGFALIENQSQLVSYAGYDVVENQSGNRIGKTKISRKGNSHIRRALHMPALNMVRYDQTPFVQLFGRILERSKIKMKGYTAVQKKLLVIIYTLWNKNEEYDPQYHFKTAEVEKEEVVLV